MSTNFNDVRDDPSVVEAADAFLARFVKQDAALQQLSDEQAKPKEAVKPAPRMTEDEVIVRKQRPLAEPEEDEETPPKTEEVEEDAEEKEAPRKYAEDDSYFKLKVGDEELEVAAKDLKRLYGQEAALTQRSQVLAEQRKKAEEETTKAVASLNLLMTRATERAAPFKNIDFYKAAQELTPDQMQNLRQEAMQRFEEENFLRNELKGFMETLKAKQEEAIETQAKEAVSQLTDPASPFYLEDWGDKLYDQLCEFAVHNGLKQEVVEQLTDAPVFKLLHQAMLYQKGAKAVVVTKKVNKEPKKIMKGTSAPAARTPDSDKEKAASQRLRRTGSTEDAAEVFLARWNKNIPED